MLESLLFSPQPIPESHLWGEYISLLGYLLFDISVTVLLYLIHMSDNFGFVLPFYFFISTYRISFFTYSIFSTFTMILCNHYCKYLYIHYFQGTVAMFTGRLQTGIVWGKEPMRMPLWSSVRTPGCTCFNRPPIVLWMGHSKLSRAAPPSSRLCFCMPNCLARGLCLPHLLSSPGR